MFFERPTLTEKMPMRILAFLTLLMSSQVLASIPECPLQSTKEMCLASVEENYQNALDFAGEEEERDVLIMAEEVRAYEVRACHKTCPSAQTVASLKAALRSGDRV